MDASGLWLEQSQKMQENDRLLKSHKLIFVSAHAQVKVQLLLPIRASPHFSCRFPTAFIACNAVKTTG
jgi:hypothetical protein